MQIYREIQSILPFNYLTFEPPPPSRQKKNTAEYIPKSKKKTELIL